MENTSKWQETLMRGALSLALWFIPLLCAFQVLKGDIFPHTSFSEMTRSVARVMASPALAATANETIISIKPLVAKTDLSLPNHEAEQTGFLSSDTDKSDHLQHDALEKIPPTPEEKPLLKMPLKPSSSKINYVKEIHCLAQAIYYEARSESLMGQLAVAEVVLNRVESGQFEESICGVVYQRTAQTCQFSFVCDGSLKEPLDQQAWLGAQKMALGIMKGKNRAKIREVTGNATHYHANYVKPNWASTMRRTATIGSHIFYRSGTADRFAQN